MDTLEPRLQEGQRPGGTAPNAVLVTQTEDTWAQSLAPVHKEHSLQFRTQAEDI